MMDSKRKSNGATGSDTDDRNSKRRKLAEFDLKKGETPESTSAYGLSFLDQLRRTSDKSGRRVAGYFETLPEPQGNEHYYSRTRMPISLSDVESKLHNREFETLTELESYLKRMITNAKDYFPRSSTTYDDAERVRKAISNYMVKTNPAYQDRSYQAVPTPLPPLADMPEKSDAQRDVEDEGGAEAEEEEEEGEAEEEEGDAEEEVEEAEEGGEDGGREPKRRSIVLKRRGSTRFSRKSSSIVEDSPRPTLPPGKQDHHYENIPYKGLDFQQAQEKIVEELLRHERPDYEDPYFEPFVNLPPRALKDYFRLIKEPLSIKKLQKQVKGVQGRQEATGVSELKSWNAFEERSKLLWTNAYFYNEPESEIYELAQALEKFFYKHFKEAVANVSEPVQPKIKLKVGQVTEFAPPKKITIHVGGRGGSAESPAPQSTDSPTANGTPVPLVVDKTRSISASVPSPSLSGLGTKMEDGVPFTSHVQTFRPPSSVSVEDHQGFARPPLPDIPALPQIPADPYLNGTYEPKTVRSAGKGAETALISSMRIQGHPHIQSDPPTLAVVLPNSKETRTSVTIHLPPTQLRLCVVTTVPEFLNVRHYSLWTLLDKVPLKQFPHPVPGQLPQERVFEVLLHPGINVIESHLISAIPKAEREEDGPETELEIFTLMVNVLKN